MITVFLRRNPGTGEYLERFTNPMGILIELKRCSTMRKRPATISWRYLPILFWFLLLNVALSGCVGQAERLWLKSPGWSRAQFVDNTRIGDPVPVAIDKDGHIYIFSLSALNDSSQIRIIALDQRAEILWDGIYEEIDLKRPGKPKILWDGEYLQLFWLSDEKLYNTQIDTSGRLLSPAMLISGETLVGHYDVAYNPIASTAVWYSGTLEEPGLYSLLLNGLTGKPTLVDADGVLPDLQFDAAGTLHAVWAHFPPGPGEKPFYYAAYPEGDFQTGNEAVIVAPRLFGTMVLEGPELGLDRQNAYIFWSSIYFSGLRSGTAETRYVYFTKGQSTTVSPAQLLNVPFEYDLEYQAIQNSPLKAGSRVPMGPGFYGGGFYIIQVAANPSSDQELVIVFHARIAYLMHKVKSQISAVFFQDGVPNGYQQLSFSPTSSSTPAIFSDNESQLYLTWLEKGELPGWIVYFASTAPDMEENLRSLTWDDLARLSAETVFGLATGALLIPIGLAWVVPSLIALALTTRIIRVKENVASLGSSVSFAIAFLVLWGIKIGVLPGILDYVPFSAWIPSISSWMYAPLRLGVPVLIGVFSLLAAWYYANRRENQSIFVFMIMYAIVDGILSMAIYGVFIFASF